MKLNYELTGDSGHQCFFVVFLIFHIFLECFFFLDEFVEFTCRLL